MNLFKAIFLTVFLTLISSANSVLAQDIVYNDGGIVYKEIINNHIVTTNEHVTISWTVYEKFPAPYTITQENGTEMIFSETTTIASVVVDTKKFSPSSVTISSAIGTSISIVIEYETPWRSTAMILVVFMVIGLATVFIVYRSLMKRTSDVAKEFFSGSNERQITRYEYSTVLFADIQGFTKITEHMNPEQLIDELDKYFVYFDDLVDKFSIEKIKTIGDAYMCAGGVPYDDSANPIEVVLVGLGMIAFVHERQVVDNSLWNIRVGINTGPVISALLGHTKKAFDIWGDTVNTASRMESSGSPGRVNISGSTYEQIHDFFDCEYRGKMPAKYKGELDMYFVNGLKPQYCQNGQSHIPNNLLKTKLQLIKATDFARLVSTRIIQPIHPNMQLRFEKLMIDIERISGGEQLPEENLTICKTVAIIWFVRNAAPKEFDSLIRDLETTLRKMHFSAEQTETIQQITSRLLQGKAPESLLEEIIYDARYQYVGEHDLEKYLNNWYKEQSEISPKRISKKDFLNEQKKLFSNFGFLTSTAKMRSEVSIQAQMKNLEQIIRS